MARRARETINRLALIRAGEVLQARGRQCAEEVEKLEEQRASLEERIQYWQDRGKMFDEESSACFADARKFGSAKHKRGLSKPKSKKIDGRTKEGRRLRARARKRAATIARNRRKRAK